jgi:hypothetical protein
MWKKNSGGKMQREQLKTIMDMMSKAGVIRITYDPRAADPTVEMWSLTDLNRDMHLEYVRFSKEETDYYNHEYDKCFGTVERSDGA